MHPEQPSDPPHRFFDTDDGTLAYTDEGHGPTTVVAVPGIPGSTRDFRWLAPALLPEFRFVRLDLPGYGQSPRQGYHGMRIAERAEAVFALIEGLELGPVLLLGHSAGGTAVAHLARHHPERVAACGLLASPGPGPHFPVLFFQILTAPLTVSPGRILMKPLLRRLYRRLGFSSQLTDQERTYSSLDAARMDFDLHRDNLAGLELPTLVAWARDDRLIPSRNFEELEEIAPPGPRLRFDRGGHNIQKTQAVELAEAIGRMAAQET